MLPSWTTRNGMRADADGYTQTGQQSGGAYLTHFLLIHGSWHGAWCWYKVAPLLEAEGHSVTVAELPGRGQHSAIPALVGLSDMVNSVMRQLPPDIRFTTLAHSRYGILASALAERFPERVERTIYLAAYMLRSGERAADQFRDDVGSKLRPGVHINRTRLWDGLKPNVYREALYHDCPVEDWMLGRLMMCHEPVRPALNRLRLTQGRYETVPRAYIRLTDDRAVTPAAQDRFLARTEVDRVEDIAASHSAYFSMPDVLCKTVIKLTGT